MITNDLMPLMDVIYYLGQISNNLAGMELKGPTGYLQYSDVLFSARQYLYDYNHLKQKEETPSE